MSEQITVTEPRVSTAGRRRTMACWPAMRCTPRARVTVMIAGSPSGMAEATSATTIMNISAGVSPRHRVPSRNTTKARPRMTSARARPKRSIWRSSGVVSWCTLRSIWLIRPSSVAAPVATTSPLAWPNTTRVPE
ncbi:hypothetical protein D3C78_1419790 [compost metagenome]